MSEHAWACPSCGAKIIGNDAGLVDAAIERHDCGRPRLNRRGILARHETSPTGGVSMAKKRKDAGPATEGRPVVRRERSELTNAVAALQRAQKRRPALATKVRLLHRASTDLTQLDTEIAQLQQAVVAAMNGAQAQTEAPVAESPGSVTLP